MPYEVKGVSPLIAVIMLIAFTLVVSGIVFSWISQFTYGQREQFQVCSKARIVTQNAYYNPVTGNVNVVVYNTGDVPLKGFSVIVTHTDSSKPESMRDFLEKEIEAQEVGLFPIPYMPNIGSIVVQALECKNAQDMINIYDVDGL
jgi:flagellin-like protein